MFKSFKNTPLRYDLNGINVVVIGALHHNTLGVIRSLGESGIKKSNINVVLVGENIPNNNIISRSRFLNTTNIFSVENDDAISLAMSNMSKDEVHRVVICCSDGSAEAIITNKELSGKFFSIPQTRLDICKLANKDIQSSIAVKCGLHVPKSGVINGIETGDWNDFPCITKPIKSVSGAGKFDIRISISKSELTKALIETEAESVQIQKYIKKKMEFQLIGLSLNGGDCVIIPGYTQIIRQPRNTNTGYLSYVPINSLNDFDKESLIGFIKHIGYSGLFSAEFIRDYNGKDYFLEMNMRNDGNAYCVKSAGVNLPFIWCYYSTFGVLPDVSQEIEKSIYFIPDFSDFRIGIKERGIFGWISDFVSAESHSIYSISDPMPFVAEIARIIKKIFKR